MSTSASSSEVVGYSLRPRFRSLLLAFLVHHNPFYLLSALCMIAGCYALNGALDLKSGEVWRVLILVGTINLYELLLIALGLFLIRGRGVLRDGRTLLLLQVVFLADLTFLNAEIGGAIFRTGVAINAVLLLLAWAKVAAVLWGVSRQGRFPGRLFLLIAVQLAALFAIPSVFKWFDREGTITARPFYAVWWVVGMIPAFAELQRRLTRPANDDAVAQRPPIGGAYAVTAFISLLVHMGMMHWVYRVSFVPADAGPVLLGLALAVRGAKPTRLAGARDLRLLQMVLPGAAVALSVAGPVDLGLALGRGGRAVVSPVLLTLVGAYLIYLYLFLSRYAMWLIAGSAVAAAVALFGPTPAQVGTSGTLAWRWSFDLVLRIMPRTAMQWGVTAVGGAFAFLGIGAAISLSQGKVTARARETGEVAMPPV